MQIIIGIGQILAVAIIPIIVWWLGIKYQDRKAKKEAQMRLFLTLMADRKSNPITLLSGEILPQRKLSRTVTLRNISSEVGLIKYIFDVASFEEDLTNRV